MDVVGHAHKYVQDGVWMMVRHIHPPPAYDFAAAIQPHFPAGDLAGQAYPSRRNQGDEIRPRLGVTMLVVLVGAEQEDSILPEESSFAPPLRTITAILPELSPFYAGAARRASRPP
jgi:hypothetical protein